MEEIPGECVNGTGYSCSNTNCHCHGIDIKPVRIKSPAEVASDQMVKWEKYIEEENIRRKGLDESHYLPKIIKEKFYRQELIIALTRINELNLKP